MPETPTFGRYAEIPYDEMTPEQQEGYRFLVETRGAAGGPSKIWVHNPKLVKAAAPLGAHFHPGGYSLSEREREIGVFRAVGASRGQVQRMLMTEAGMIGGVATLLGSASGLLLAMVLTWVVNPAFFGWTIAFRLPWASLLTTPLWIIPAALLAAWHPAWRASHRAIATAVREE